MTRIEYILIIILVIILAFVVFLICTPRYPTSWHNVTELRKGDVHVDQKVETVEYVKDELRGDHVFVTWDDGSYSTFRPSDKLKVER